MLNRLVFCRASKVVLLCALTSVCSFGAVIYDSGVTSLLNTGSTQLGRLSRSGVISDWSSQKTFPGVLNPAVAYHYTTYAIPVTSFPYLQISFYDQSGDVSLFASAYLDAYTPNSSATNRGLDTNYLGDAGQSGTLNGNPDAFQVIVQNVAADNLVVVVNDASAIGLGVGEQYEVLVEGFYDTMFNDNPPVLGSVVPEPVPSILTGLGLAATLFGITRRKHTSQ